MTGKLLLTAEASCADEYIVGVFVVVPLAALVLALRRPRNPFYGALRAATLARTFRQASWGKAGWPGPATGRLAP